MFFVNAAQHVYLRNLPGGTPPSIPCLSLWSLQAGRGRELPEGTSAPRAVVRRSGCPGKLRRCGWCWWAGWRGARRRGSRCCPGCRRGEGPAQPRPAVAAAAAGAAWRALAGCSGCHAGWLLSHLTALMRTQHWQSRARKDELAGGVGQTEKFMNDLLMRLICSIQNLAKIKLMFYKSFVFKSWQFYVDCEQRSIFVVFAFYFPLNSKTC